MRKEHLMTPFCKRGDEVRMLHQQQLANIHTYFHGPTQSLEMGAGETAQQ